jgi:trans-2-enoyl-CoA reductase
MAAIRPLCQLSKSPHVWHSPASIRRAPYSSHRSQFTRLYQKSRSISTYGYTQSKALVYTQPSAPIAPISSNLHLHPHSLSPPHGTQVTLRTLAAPINPADVNQIQGTYGAQKPFTRDLGTAEPSAVGGNEGLFEVTAVGGDVAKQPQGESDEVALRVGDLVVPRRTGLGTWRTHLQAPSSSLLRLGPSTQLFSSGSKLSKTQLAGITVNPITAWCMLREFVPPKPGDWVLQNGANSAVGRYAVQLARRWGLKTINVVRDRARLGAEMENLGADVVVSEVEVLDKSFAGRVKDWTTGKGVGLVLNCVGGKAGIAAAKVLKEGGTHITYGAMSKQGMAVPAGMLIFKDISFKGFWVSRWGDEHGEDKEKIVKELVEMMSKGELIEGPIEEVKWNWATPREELVKDVERTLEGGRKGKGVFVFGDDTK